jgi:hypothetical protein
VQSRLLRTMAAADDMDDDLVDVMAVDDDEPQARRPLLHALQCLGRGLIAAASLHTHR